MKKRHIRKAWWQPVLLPLFAQLFLVSGLRAQTPASFSFNSAIVSASKVFDSGYNCLAPDPTPTAAAGKVTFTFTVTCPGPPDPTAAKFSGDVTFTAPPTFTVPADPGVPVSLVLNANSPTSPKVIALDVEVYLKSTAPGVGPSNPCYGLFQIGFRGGVFTGPIVNGTTACSLSEPFDNGVPGAAIQARLILKPANAATNITYYILAYYTPNSPGGDRGEPGPFTTRGAPEPSDTRFVARADDPMVCKTRHQGPITLDIPITRYVGSVTSEGFLSDPDLLIANGLITPLAKLTLRVWDIDSDANPGGGINPERDSVSVNGFTVSIPGRFLTGVDQQWVTNQFYVPIKYLKFPSDPGLKPRGEAEAPNPAMNRISIDIDTANTQEAWCTSVAWASLSFDAMAPWMLVHGTNADHRTWELKAVDDTSPVDRLNALGIPFEHRIDLVPNGTPDENAALLSQSLLDQARRFGVKSLHLITHSKGATDSRRFFETFLPTHSAELTILDLYSIGTPSQGTILSDYALAADKLCVYVRIPIPPTPTEIPVGPACDGLAFLDPVAKAALLDAAQANWLGSGGPFPHITPVQNVTLAPVDPARAVQTIAAMGDFNKANPKSFLVPHYYSIAGDADDNNNQRIDRASEIRGFFTLPDGSPPPLLSEEKQISIADRIYQALGRTWLAKAVELSAGRGNGSYWTFKVGLVPVAQPNDLVSAADSVHCQPCGFVPLGGLGTPPVFHYNHTSLKNAGTMDLILQQIHHDYPLQFP